MEDEKESDDFATSVLNKRAKLSSDSAFTNCKLLQPTSNLFEMFFSKVGLAVGDLRRCLTPEHLEEQLFLNVNGALWDINTVSSILNENQE